MQGRVLDGDRVVGQAELTNDLINEATRDNGQWLMVVSEEPRVQFSVPIELRAADVSRRGNLLSLWLHWRARQAPGVDTKYFVHVLDAADKVVWQEGGIHVKYTRPSSEWQADGIVSELIERLAPSLTHIYCGDPGRLPEVGIVLVGDQPAHCQPVAIRPGTKVPGIHICFDWMNRLPAERVERLLAQLEAEPALASVMATVRPADFKKRPSISFELLHDADLLEIVIAALSAALAPGDS